MSSAPQLNIDHIAKLARLALTPEEKAKYAQQVGDVLHHIEQLSK
jgi:aspartyl-tRNA(Asn)/glutamyl-tRNA(Gln) amidotransferase subunit C